MKAFYGLLVLVIVAALGAGAQSYRAAESASENILSRIARAQELNRREAGQISDEEWSYIRSEVYRGRGSNVVEVLTGILRQGKSERTMAAIADLGKTGPPAASAVPALMTHFEEMEDWNDFRAFYVSEALQEMGSAASNAVPALISAIQKTPALRATAVEALGGIGRPASNAIPILKPFMQSSDGALAFSALNALARIEEDPAEYLRGLIRGLNSSKEREVLYMRATEAMATFEALGPAARAAIPALIRQLDHPTDDHVKAAARALGAMRAHGAPAEKKLRAVAESNRYETETRIVAAEALGEIMGGLARRSEASSRDQRGGETKAGGAVEQVNSAIREVYEQAA